MHDIRWCTTLGGALRDFRWCVTFGDLHYVINTVVMLFTFQTTTVNKCRCEILNECICIASMPVVNYYKVGK